MERLSVEAVLRAIGDVERAFVAFASETAKIRDRALPWCEGRGLDLGCGSDKIRPEALGIDLRESPVRDLHADVSGPLPFESGAFDYVFSSHCLEDIWDTEATLEEWVRVVRPGGRLIFYLPHPQHYRGYNADHRHQGFTQEDMAALLPPAGCRVLVNELDADGDDRYSIFVVGEKHVGT